MYAGAWPDGGPAARCFAPAGRVYALMKSNLDHASLASFTPSVETRAGHAPVSLLLLGMWITIVGLFLYTVANCGLASV